MLELLIIPFYLIYLIEWLLRLMQTRHLVRAYRRISFEREAYAHQSDAAYLRQRPAYAWLRYLIGDDGM